MKFWEYSRFSQTIRGGSRLCKSHPPWNSVTEIDRHDKLSYRDQWQGTYKKQSQSEVCFAARWGSELFLFFNLKVVWEGLSVWYIFARGKYLTFHKINTSYLYPNPWKSILFVCFFCHIWVKMPHLLLFLWISEAFDFLNFFFFSFFHSGIQFGFTIHYLQTVMFFYRFSAFSRHSALLASCTLDRC